MNTPSSPLPAGVGRQDSVVLFDGVCNMCSGLVQFLVRLDRPGKLHLASLQSTPGQALLRWCGQPLHNFDTMVFIERGRPYFKSTAALRIPRYFAWPWPLVSLLLVIPAWLRDWCYDGVARNRYRLFGRTETCMMPTPDVARRFLR